MERDDHTENIGVIDATRQAVFDTHKVPGGHCRKEQEQKHRQNGNEKGDTKRAEKSDLGDAVLIIPKPCEGGCIRQGKGRVGDIELPLEGVDEYP